MIDIEKNIVVEGQRNVWAICVTYLERPQLKAKSSIYVVYRMIKAAKLGPCRAGKSTLAKAVVAAFPMQIY